MTDEQMTVLAKAVGFSDAAVVDTKEIPFEPGFRVCCEENSCGKYGINYACPPDCGSTDDMRRRVQERQKALLLQTLWEIDDPMDPVQTKAAKGQHNRMVRSLIDQLERDHHGFMIGASGCNLCPRCAIEDRKPCRFPDLQFSCMSAYCIYVQQLVEQYGMEYDAGPGLVALFGMYVFDERKTTT